MKTVIIILLIGGVIIFMVSGCWNYSADSAPGVAVYKTKGDYFNNVSVGIKKNGEVYHYPGFYNPGNGAFDSRIKITDDDTVYTGRAKLINGYIISEEISENSIFLNFTFKEFIRLLVKNDEGIFDVLQENILDDDPFLELYFDKNKPRKYELPDTILINQMIRDGELGKYFERVK